MSKLMKEDDPFYDAKVQKILNKLVSEEIIASNFYLGCIMACQPDERKAFSEMFIEIAQDEMDDHCKKLCVWASNCGYSVPFKFKDFEKYAAKSVFAQYDKLKDGQGASYYVDEAIKSEEDAIKSYKEAMEYEDIPQDLNAILLQNYYDELEHLENLQTLKMAVDGQVDLINW